MWRFSGIVAGKNFQFSENAKQPAQFLWRTDLADLLSNNPSSRACVAARILDPLAAATKDAQHIAAPFKSTKMARHFGGSAFLCDFYPGGC